MRDTTDIDPVDPVEQRLRHTLHTVAGTVTERPSTASAPAARPSRHRRRLLVGACAVALPLTVAAAGYVHEVRPVPPGDVVMRGEVDGERYLLMETHREDPCGNPVTGVMLVEESRNLLGSEWSTTGHEYGEYVESDCGGPVIGTTRFLGDPALYTDSGGEVGDSFVWVFDVHPDVTAVRISSVDFVRDLAVYEVDGAGYAPFAIPDDLDEYTSELVMDGKVVPGSLKEQTVPDLG